MEGALTEANEDTKDQSVGEKRPRSVVSTASAGPTFLFVIFVAFWSLRFGTSCQSWAPDSLLPPSRCCPPPAGDKFYRAVSP